MLRRRKGIALAAIDLLSGLFLVALVQMAPPPSPRSAVRTFGTYAVVLTWPKKCNADLDLYLREPNSTIVFYNHLNGTVAHLEHDDIPGAGLGYSGQENFERIVLRGVEPGEFVVNVRDYSPYACKPPIPATIELWRLSGRDERVTARRLSMRSFGDEQTAFRFSLGRDGTVRGINRLPRKLS